MKSVWRTGGCAAVLLWAGILYARILPLTLWVSGGCEGILTAGGDAPGWLGVSRHITAQDPKGFWLDVGGTADAALLMEIGGLARPDAVVPSEATLRFQTAGRLAAAPLPYTALNLAMLPQFPSTDVPVPAFREVEQADELGFRFIGLLSDGAPLRVPPVCLRPLQVLPPETALRAHRIAHPTPDRRIPVVVIPEQADGAAWSRRFPGIPVLVEFPSGRPEVIEMSDGAQLRVRPGRHGRAVIRVTLRWDTVRGAFLPPQADIEWVRRPDLEALDLPAEAVQRLRPLPAEALPVEPLSVANASVLAPAGMLRTDTPTPGEVMLPDAWRIRLLETDTLPVGLQQGVGESENEVWIPARLAAGNGGDAWLTLRQFLDEIQLTPERPVRSQRERLVPVTKENTP